MVYHIYLLPRISLQKWPENGVFCTLWLELLRMTAACRMPGRAGVVGGARRAKSGRVASADTCEVTRRSPQRQGPQA